MFRYDGPIFEFMNKVADLLILGFIWAVMCIPIFTIGASTTAAYYVAFNQLDKKEGYIISKFFRSFKQNFKQATIAYLIILAVGIVVSANILALSTGIITLPGAFGIIFLIAQYLILIEILIINTYIFALLSKIEFSVKQLFISAAVIGNKHFGTTILNALVVVGIFLLCVMVPFMLLFSGGLYILCSTFLIKKVLKKYRPEMFSDSDLELENKSTTKDNFVEVLNDTIIHNDLEEIDSVDTVESIDNSEDE